MNVNNLVYVEADKLFEMLERTRLIQFHIANMKRQMEQGVFMCIDTNEETILYYSNNEREELAIGMNILMEQMVCGKKVH